jgi:hypothetical protein
MCSTTATPLAYHFVGNLHADTKYPVRSSLWQLFLASRLTSFNPYTKLYWYAQFLGSMHIAQNRNYCLYNKSSCLILELFSDKPMPGSRGAMQLLVSLSPTSRGRPPSELGFFIHEKSFIMKTHIISYYGIVEILYTNIATLLSLTLMGFVTS